MSEHPYRARMRHLLGDDVVDRGLAAEAQLRETAPFDAVLRELLAQVWHPVPVRRRRSRDLEPGADPLRGVA